MTDERRLGYHFAAIPDWVLGHPDLDGNAVRVFGLMAKFTDPYLALGTLAEGCRCSEDTVRRAIRKLQGVGAVRVVPRYREDGAQTSNQYHLAGDTPLAPVPPPPVADLPPDPVAATRPELDNEVTRQDQKTKPSREVATLLPPQEPLFDQFWQAYPRKVGKPPTRTAFERAAAKADIADIASGLRAWCAYWRSRGEPEFIPHPTTWLNQERWNDVPKTDVHETTEERFARLFPESVNGSR